MLKSTDEGEILGIGLDNDNDETVDVTNFQLAGSASSGTMTTLLTTQLTESSGWKHYRIPVGSHFTGSMTHITFV